MYAVVACLVVFKWVCGSLSDLCEYFYIIKMVEDKILAWLNSSVFKLKFRKNKDSSKKNYLVKVNSLMA